MNQTSVQTVMFLFLLIMIGCGDSSPPPTLVIHAHDGVYDFLDPAGKPIETGRDLDEFDAALKQSNIKLLIRRNRVILRFKGEPTADGMTIPDSLTPAMAKLVAAGITRQDFEYLND